MFAFNAVLPKCRHSLSLLDHIMRLCPSDVLPATVTACTLHVLQVAARLRVPLTSF